MLYKLSALLISILLLSSYFGVKYDVYGRHSEIFIPVLQMEPKSPIAGQEVKLTTVVTNLGNSETQVIVSYNLDGDWIIDEVKVDVPSQKSVQASFSATLPIKSGSHELKACPDRKSLGDDGDHCQILEFVAIDESSITVVIISPQDNTVLSGSANFSVISLGDTAQKVELYIENDLVDAKMEQPFDFTVDTTKFEDGRYSVYAIAYYESGLSRPSSVKKYIFENAIIENFFVTVRSDFIQEASVRTDQSVVIESDIRNAKPFKIPATFIVLVKNSRGFSEFLQWKEYSISSNQTLAASRTWVPQTPGQYDVEVFIWNTIENAVPLSGILRAKIDVSSQP